MDQDRLPHGEGVGALILLLNHSRAIAEWVRAEMGLEGFGPCQAIGVLDGTELICGVVYSNYSGPNVMMTIHATSPRWARRGIIGAFFRYPFKQLGCSRVTAIVDEANERSLKLCLGVGFQPEGRMRKCFPPRDGIVLGMTADECRWIKEKVNGKEYERA